MNKRDLIILSLPFLGYSFFSQNKTKLIGTFFIFWLCFLSVAGQKDPVDSLRRALIIAKQDTQVCKLYYELGRQKFTQYSDSALPYFEKSIQLAEKKLSTSAKGDAQRNAFLKYCADSYKGIAIIADVRGDNERSIAFSHKSYELKKKRKDVRGMSDLLNNIGNSYDHLGYPDSALSYHNKSLALRQKINSVEGIGQSFSNIGNVYYGAGDLVKAIEYYSKAIQTLQNSKYKKEYAHALRSMSYAYGESGDIVKALEYVQKSFEIDKQNGDQNGMALALVRKGVIYFNTGDYKKAQPLYEEALKIYEGIGNSKGAAEVYNNIAGIYFMTDDIKNAGVWLKKAILIYEKSGDKHMQALSYGNLAEIYLKQGNKGEGIKMLLRSKQLSFEIGSPARAQTAASMLYEEYRSSGNYKLALENYELYIKMKDSVNNQSARKAILKAQARHEYEVKAAADSVSYLKETEVKNAELARQNAEIRASKNQLYGLIGGLVLVLVFAAVMYNRFKVTKQQKSIIEDQKQLVEEKQKEILDSIHYAKRIQSSLLPTNKYVEKSLKRLKDNEG